MYRNQFHITKAVVVVFVAGSFSVLFFEFDSTQLLVPVSVCLYVCIYVYIYVYFEVRERAQAQPVQELNAIALTVVSAVIPFVVLGHLTAHIHTYSCSCTFSSLSRQLAIESQ